MNYVVCDVETYDPWINEGRGSGWPENQAEFLCAVTEDKTGRSTCWSKEQMNDLQQYLKTFDMIIAHNAQYEMGILHSYGYDIEQQTWLCTRLLCVLHNNNFMSFSLNSMAQEYLGSKKNSDEMIGQAAIELGLLRPKTVNPGKAALKKYTREIYEALPTRMLQYCAKDVELTHRLYSKLKDSITDIAFYSDLMKALTLSRARGIRVHTPTLLALGTKIRGMLNPLNEELKKYNLNPASPSQLAGYFSSVGVKLPLSEKGNPSTGTEALENIDHPLAKLVLEHRGLTKLVTSYIDPLMGLIKDDEEYIKVYPEITIFGAVKTGRAACRNPNIQNVPTRKALGNEIRSLYHPHDGEQIASLDYSGQELRLIVHYASLLSDVEEYVKGYRADPEYDIYATAAKLLDIPRGEAKTTMLGIAYGLWYTTLAKRLDISEGRAEALMQRMVDVFPFLKSLFISAKNVVARRGYVKTILGRKIYIDKEFSRNAINAIIQGSAADQTNKAIVDCYRKGIIILAPIHDELLISSPNELYLNSVREIMENTIKLNVPCVVHIATGSNWGELK